ncbi:dTDP-4-dehydrorhamnose 3,5-epimerase [Rhizobium leucaenae]|uniref:dTDP-4-dehydrorhamnose 3,5-epimerase n=1 Tax=Rhizobium leucaenae TaxID=29450 RepID=A0A7W6ZSC4_9HYPH|nr:dTDP-4-dehydrorhamnose 3,5-epimerase [Rhizobium leucaenae]MBB4567834.1 dTDP-4-dehydrorhamnose 3,5-epimerase [Rhizobium leucaenae]MBB6301099.1 dTDP-4-dehydrorhamnose 3,5-epimerase [Rhizobium leucaenae]
MKAIDTAIPDVKIIEPAVFADDRGFFFESFSQIKFEAATGLSPTFVQDNHSRSGKGVLRGLHYQLPPRAQAKLVRVVIGEVYDVAVDIRRSSPTFGQWVGVLLSEANKRQLWIPEGFAHGFLTLSDRVEFLYKTTDYYAPESDRGIRWDDPTLAIDWKTAGPLTFSDKDQRQPLLADAEIFD